MPTKKVLVLALHLGRAQYQHIEVWGAHATLCGKPTKTDGNDALGAHPYTVVDFIRASKDPAHHCMVRHTEAGRLAGFN